MNSSVYSRTGNLALSRALGDFEFKQNGTLSAEKQVVTADPDIIFHEKTDEDEFLILACDGEHFMQTDCSEFDPSQVFGML